MRKCSLDSINKIFGKISETNKLYLPVDGSDGVAVYTKWEEGKEWSNALNTVRSPKDFFFPQVENLMEFKTSGKNIELTDIRCEAEDFVIFGVRACDVRSFDILDRVFLTDPVDSFYASRREHGVIVSVACSKPSETCFCQTFACPFFCPPEMNFGFIWSNLSFSFLPIALRSASDSPRVKSANRRESNITCS